MASTQSPSDTLEGALHQWMTQEMKFDSSPYVTSPNFHVPSQTQLKKLCQGPMIKVWRHIIQHVKATSTVDHVKKNLAVHQFAQKGHHRQPGRTATKKEEEEEEDEDGLEKLRRDRQQLSSELFACEADVKLLEKELDHNKTELAHLEQSYQSVCQRVRDLQKKESLLCVAGGCARDDTMNKYQEYTNRISQRVRDVSFRGTDLSEPQAYTGQKDSDELESESCREVRVACEGVSRLLHATVDGQFTTDHTRLEKAQEKLWQDVQKTASHRTIGQTVKALIANTHSATKHLREETLNLDIAKDADNLSFSYKSSGKLEDMSTPPTVEKNVQQLLLASNMEHVLRFFKEQEHRNENWKLEARLDDIMAQIHKHIHKVMAEHPRNVALAKSYVDVLISAAVERSVVPCLKSELDGLLERIHTAKQEKEELHAKHNSIQDFKHIVERKQNLITALAKQNANAHDRLAEKRGQVSSYIESRSMPSHGTIVEHFCNNLKGSLVSEMDKFSPLLLPCMLSVQLDSSTRVGVVDLALAPVLHPTLRDKMKTDTKLCSTLHFPQHKSPDQVAVQVLEIHQQLQQLKCSQQRRDDWVRMSKNNTRSSDDIQALVDENKRIISDLCITARQHGEEQRQKLMPQLEKCLKILTSLADEVEATQSLITVWSEQPAQLTTPWIKTEGLTFDQWLHRWRVAVTQVHKLMVQTPHK